MDCIEKDLKIALIYDFDGTLSCSNIQESSFIPSLKMSTQEFWDMTNRRTVGQKMERVLSYMTLMLDKARENGQKLTVESLKSHGKKNDQQLFPGLLGKDNWFYNIKKTLKSICPEMTVQHYIISAGIREMIEGSAIAKEFEHIFASSFMYDNDGIALYPAVAINYTGKIQFLYRINKGVTKIYDDHSVNEYVEKNRRPIPFSHMIYIGDGTTDIPAMKMVSDKGGFSIGVYDSVPEIVEKIFLDKRIDYFCKANYTKESDLFDTVILNARRIYYQWKIYQKTSTLSQRCCYKMI